jgi:hypothetical protein
MTQVTVRQPTSGERTIKLSLSRPTFIRSRTWQALALFEFWWQPVSMLERPVDQSLRSQPDAQPIIEYPLSSAFDGRQLVYRRAHGKPILHGYATYFSLAVKRQYPELLDFPEPAVLQTLAGLGVRYVLVETARPHTDEATALLADIDRNSCLQRRTAQVRYMYSSWLDVNSPIW